MPEVTMWRVFRIRTLWISLKRQSPLTLFASFLSICLIVVLMKLAFHSDDRVLLAVVDEHHEVLPYWFEAAEMGVIPMRGVTLVHISSHADESIPDYIPGMPFLHFPKDEEEIEFLMQRKDVVIQAAAMTGLVSKVIWIYPSWDKDQKEPELQREVNFGHASIRFRSVRETRLCNCIKEMESKSKDHQCFVVHFEDKKPNLRAEMSISSKRCKLSKMFSSIHLRDSTALEKLATGSLIDDDEAVILDINEDFFGSESGIIQMNEAGVPTDTVIQVNAKLKELFCPRFIKHESAADTLMKDVFALMLKVCNWDKSFIKCELSFGELQRKTMEMLSNTFKSFPSLFCGKSDGDIQPAWDNLLGMLHATPYLRLRALLDMGVCLNTSPETFGFIEEEEGAIVICHGLNFPNSTGGYLHIPSDREITHREHILKDLFTQVHSITQPKLITLSRSIRDGFTPRNISTQIEGSILRSLSHSDVVRDANLRVEYSKNLLGGQKGWNARYKPEIT